MTQEITNFKRVEKKYVLTLEQKALLLEKFSDRFAYDSFGKDGNYKLESMYYDTPDLKFYWEKIHKNNKRIKIRLRRYVYETPDFSEKSKVFIEIKEKNNGVGLKRRVKMSYEEAKNLLEKGIIPEHKAKNAEIIQELHTLATENTLSPMAITSYDRQAFFDTTDPKLRLTFDTNVKYNRKDIYLDTQNKGGRIIPNKMTILEVKALGELPEFLLDFFEENNISSAKISKYCGAIEKSDALVRMQKQKAKKKRKQRKYKMFINMLRQKAFA